MPAVEIPGYVAGTWDIGPVYSHLDFVGRHIVVGKVRGRFEEVRGPDRHHRGPDDRQGTRIRNDRGRPLVTGANGKAILPRMLIRAPLHPPR
jgi:hypothetical protein